MHCLNDEVTAIWNADRVVEGEEMGGKLVAEGVGDVACDEAADCGRNAEGAEFGGIGGILVETE